MEIEIFTLADFAQDSHSKLTIVGTFDTIHSKQFPAVHKSCSIACRLRFSPKESGSHNFRLRLINSKGTELMQPVEGTINIPSSTGDHPTGINIVAGFNQLKFDEPGRYSFELYIDGEWETGLPLYLKQMN